MDKSIKNILKEIVAEMKLEGKEFFLTKEEITKIVKHLKKGNSANEIEGRLKGNKK